MARGTVITKVTKDGTKRYKTVIRINGKQQWRTWDRKRDADAYLDDLSPEIRDHTYREIKKATFAEYVTHWQATHLIPEKFKPSTYGGYRSIIEFHLLPAFKNYPLAAISPAEINSLVAKLLKTDPVTGRKPIANKSVRNVLNLLNRIFSKALTENYLKLSPMSGVERPRIEKEQKGRALKPEEIQAILKACNPTLRPMVATAIATGMRSAEQFALDWENVDFENNVIKVRRALFWLIGKYHETKEGEAGYVFVTPKSKKSIRDIDMSPELRKELLALYIKGGRKGLVFCTSKGTPLYPPNITKRSFGKVLHELEAERAKNKLPAIGKVRWHDLRHTFGSLKIAQGENPFYIMRQMGHSSIQVTYDVYGHLLESRNPEAAAKTDSAIFGQ